MLTLKPEKGRVAVPAFSNLLENFFESDFPTFFSNEMRQWAQPSVNIKDTKEAYLIEVAAPGFEKENIGIKVEDNILTISAEAKEDKLEEGERFTRKEFSHTSFKRSFTLPKTIVADKINAGYEKGVLKVTLPKMEEAKQKGAVEIKIS
ncbi:MAG TPA: Hsp20/alpha crystallin family protein [Chitinophagales bacterium]|nr:Hsp20/alpha crystallin family protein [Chitinophagales bacterium]